MRKSRRRVCDPLGMNVTISILAKGHNVELGQSRKKVWSLKRPALATSMYIVGHPYINASATAVTPYSPVTVLVHLLWDIGRHFRNQSHDSMPDTQLSRIYTSGSGGASETWTSSQLLWPSLCDSGPFNLRRALKWVR